MNRRRRSLGRKQRGFLLIALVALLAIGGLYFFISNLSPEQIQARRRQLTGEALAQAREALIGYAVRFREDQLATGTSGVVYGYLPLPDLGNTRNQNVSCTEEGCDAANFAGNALNVTVIGRFPWRTLGTGPLRDSDGECLWYAVSGSHQRIQQTSPMNWDTLSQLDVVVANGTAAMVSAITSAHDRPIAVIFSPGPPLAGQDRSASISDSVAECGGNYAVGNYLDPVVATNLGGVTNYLAGINKASGDTSAANKALTANDVVNRRSDGMLWTGNCPSDNTSPCAVVANDTGVTVTSDLLFRTLRGSSYFRTDINSMLDRMVGCIRDEIVAAGGSLATPYAKIAGADANTCYGTGVDPLGYYPNYRQMVFVAAPGTVTATVDGVAQSCSGALLFAGQRDTATLRCPVANPTTIQKRSPGAEQLDACNYLEDDSMHDGTATLTDNNLTSFTGSGTTFAGPSRFSPVSTSHPAHQDIVRCIPSTTSLVAAPSALPPGAELSQYNPATRTLTLGRVNVESDQGYSGSSLFGCAWTPEALATGSGFRSYFKFNILDAGDGFVFASVDGDRNSTSVCGAGEQHLGYSGYNGGANSPILYPKLGLEFDTRRNYRSNPPFLPDGFDPERVTSTFPLAFRTLANGRSDPNYAGGHIGLVYWGGETLISTSDGTSNTCTVNADCLSPATCDTGVCKLTQAEDDNVHGQLPATPATRPPPRNEPAPITPPSPPPYPPYAVDKLDPSLSSVPTNQDIHVRVEVARVYSGRDDNSRLARVVANTSLATLSGLQTIDSIALQAGDSVLVAGQAIARNNGLYVAAAGAWSRATNADEPADLSPGSSWFIKEGTAYRGSLWRLQNAEAPLVGTGEIVISLFRQAVKAVSTANLALSGLQTVDGVVLAAGDRVLLAGQADARENGVYSASAGAWSRATPEDTAAGLKDGATWFSASGAGSYWRLSGNATPGTSSIAISQLSFPSNDVYFATLTTQVWKLTDSPTVANQIANMKTTTRSMNQLDPVVRHATCLAGNTCPASSPAGQSCGGVETDGFRYCYTGQKPNLYDSKRIYDIRGTTSCASGASCTGNEFCGIDNVCYQAALRTTRQGFTDSQSTQSQVISISDFFTTWLP